MSLYLLLFVGSWPFALTARADPAGPSPSSSLSAGVVKPGPLETGPPAPASVTLSKEGLVASVKAAPGEVVSLPGCRGLGLEAFDTELDRFVPVDLLPCSGREPTVVVGEQPVELVPLPRQQVSGVVRAVVVMGVGCAPDLPLEVADCARITAATSEPVSIGLTRTAGD